MEILSIDPVAQSVINHYRNLSIGNQKIVCPYYINAGHIKDLRVMVGKGTPEEIEMETKIWAQLKGMDLEKMSPQQIRDFMQQRRLGIDCSGFIYHVYDKLLQSKNKPGLAKLIKHPSGSLLTKLKLWLRPAENIGANLVTGPLNSKIIQLKDIRPGDLIRSKAPRQNADHVLLITEVAYKDGIPQWFKYAHSISQFGKNNGVREGNVEITDVNGELKDQNWTEVDETGKSPTLEGLQINYQDNGLRRPNFLSIL